MLVPSFTVAKPLLKWAGGKGKLLPNLLGRLPPALQQGRIKRYAEPFLGGGALFFYLAQHYDFEQVYIGDANPDLVLTYEAVREVPDLLLAQLQEVQDLYNALPVAGQVEYYYHTRTSFNTERIGWDYRQLIPTSWVHRAAQFIFLNRTCFNGLYRVNKQAAFNVPHGKYQAVILADAANVLAASRVLRRTELRAGDFSTSESFLDHQTLVYFDPPYRPLTPTASFTAYASLDFNDADQIRLAALCRRLHARDSFFMLSNSDPATAVGDPFFEQLYAGFAIERLQARRAINATGTGRGAVSELIITNYSY